MSEMKRVARKDPPTGSGSGLGERRYAARHRHTDRFHLAIDTLTVLVPVTGARGRGAVTGTKGTGDCSTINFTRSTAIGEHMGLDKNVEKISSSHKQPRGGDSKASQQHERDLQKVQRQHDKMFQK